jgi:adenosylmethionine-8-amino-7-oxononanoate aminotransferase
MKESPVRNINQKLNASSRLLLHRTTRQEISEGVTVIVKGEGIYVYDQDGKRYLDLDAGVTRPVHVGHGRKELALKQPMIKCAALLILHQCLTQTTRL